MRVELPTILKGVTLKDKQNSFIQHSLKVRAAVDDNNYVSFFKLYLNAPNMGAYIMDSFVEKLRIQALLTICYT